MTGGQKESPRSPFDFPGPTPPPTSDSLAALASDANLDKNVQLVALTGLIATKSFDAGVNATKNEKKTSYPWWAILIYASIIVVAFVIYFRSDSTEDHKNQALGFVFGQTPLLFASFFKRGDKG